MHIWEDGCWHVSGILCIGQDFVMDIEGESERGGGAWASGAKS